MEFGKRGKANNLEFGTRGNWTTLNSVRLITLHKLLLLTNIIAIATLLKLCNKVRHAQKVIGNLESQQQRRNRAEDQGAATPLEDRKAAELEFGTPHKAAAPCRVNLTR